MDIYGNVYGGMEHLVPLHTYFTEHFQQDVSCIIDLYIDPHRDRKQVVHMIFVTRFARRGLIHAPLQCTDFAITR